MMSPLLALLSAVRSGAGSDFMTFGIITDVHYADADPAGTRVYRDSLPKVEQAVSQMISSEVDFMIELGDFKDTDASHCVVHGPPSAECECPLLALAASSLPCLTLSCASRYQPDGWVFASHRESHGSVPGAKVSHFGQPRRGYPQPVNRCVSLPDPLAYARLRVGCRLQSWRMSTTARSMTPPTHLRATTAGATPPLQFLTVHRLGATRWAA